MARKATETPKTIPAATSKGSLATLSEADGVVLNTVIKDKDKAKAFTDRALSIYAQGGKMVHVAFVTAFWHVATHGHPALLNRLTLGLRPNDQAAVKKAVRRMAILTALRSEDGSIPEGLSPEVIQGYVNAGMIVDFSKGSFIVVRGHTSEEAKYVAAICENKMIDPSGAFSFVLDRDNYKEAAILGESQLIGTALSSVSKAIEKKSADGKPILGNRFLTYFKKVRDDLEAMKLQATIGD